MNQPTKDALREQLALAADEIIRLRNVCVAAEAVLIEARAFVEKHRRPWWRRWFA